jgi:hypothetical protein
MLLGKVGIYLQMTEIRSQSLTLHSINSKWIKDLKERTKTEITAGKK